jgi:MoaA/NifB/PqqE/SkfB family radical SAM enzyme
MVFAIRRASLYDNRVLLGARVVVVFPPVRVSPDFIDYPYFADLGAIQAAATLRAAGAEVHLADAFALPGATLTRGSAEDGTRPSSEEGAIERAQRPASLPIEASDLVLGASETTLFEVLPASAAAFVVAFTPFHRPPARDLSLGSVLARLRREHPETPILLADLYQSGQHVVDARSADVLASYPEVDVLLRYEAEACLPAIVLDLVQNGRPPRPRALDGTEPSGLDTLPLPAWDLLDLKAYFAFHEAVVQHLGRPSWAFPITGSSAPLLTSRGCPYRCVHCSSNPSSRKDGVLVAPKTQRRYSPAYLDRLLGDLAARGVRRVHLLDELCNVNEAHFDAVLALLEKHGLSFEIPNGVRADYVLDRHLEKMRGRLTTLSVSAESGVQKVVDEIVDKQLDLSAITSVAERAQAAGVPLLVHFMIGLPGETRRDINGTLEFALDLHERTGALPSVQFATPLPGTRLARMAEGKRALPLVRDYGPLFQREPSIETDSYSLADLRKAKWTFDQRIQASGGPKKVIMNVTYKCNNRCTFCATGTRTQVDGDYDRQRELLVKYRKLGVTLLDFDGGEPTLNDKLLRLVGFARKIGYERVNVTTNGRMASYPDFARKLVNSGVTSILVSIHGPDAQTHAQNVGVAEAFDQTCAGVKNLVRLAPPHVELGANITITRSNHLKLFDVATLIESLGLGWLNIQFLTPFGRATSSVCPDTQVAANEAMRTIDAFKDRMKIQVINLPFCFMPGYETFMMGDLLKLERHMLFVNNDEVNLFEYLRERRSKKPVCETCPHSIFCGGFYEMDDVPEPTWLIRPEDLIRPIADRIPVRTSGLLPV